MPVYDKHDDIFDGVPGVKSSSAWYDDVFRGSSATPPAHDDLLTRLGKKSEAREESEVEEKRRREPAPAWTGFNNLIPGFGGSSRSRQRLVLLLLFNVHGVVGCYIVDMAVLVCKVASILVV
jgi:hypothetical protein